MLTDPSNLLLLFAFVLAIAIGWWLGRRQKSPSELPETSPEEYLGGIHFLLNEQSDEAIERFLNALDVNANTVETHLALGRLFRRRGEVDKATSIHQGLLAREGLGPKQADTVQLELASDYLTAGLLDRAERLLRQMAQGKNGADKRSQRLLMVIYQREKDWEQAIEVALSLLQYKDDQVAPVLAHYYCESALESVEKGDISAARRQLKRANNYDPHCVRASLLLGQLELKAERFSEAIKEYKRVKRQDSAFLPEVIGPLRECYRRLGKTNELKAFLQECLEHDPSVTAVFVLAELLYSNPGELSKAQQFVVSQLMKRPSLKGLHGLLEMQLRDAGGGERQRMEALYELVKQLLAAKPVYRCSQCGYAGRQLTWLCPGCEQWGTIKPIYGLEGE